VIFGIDDPEINIEGCPHTLLAAMGAHNPETLESALAVLKRDFGLNATEEVKWNGMPPLAQKAREELSQELMVLLHDSVPLVAITEGRDKNQAAQESARQIADFLAASSSSASHETIHLLFDESIIDDPIEFTRHLRTLAPSPISVAEVESVHSHEHALIQIADVLAGFSHLATEIALGREDKQITIWDDGFSSDIPTTLLPRAFNLKKGLASAKQARNYLSWLLLTWPPEVLSPAKTKDSTIETHRDSGGTD